MQTGAAVRAGTRELLGLCAGSLLVFVAFSMTVPLIPLQVTALGQSPGMLGVLVSLTSIGSLLAAMPGGMMLQRIGSRRLIVTAAVVMTIACAVLYTFGGLGALYGALTLLEIGKILFSIGAQGHVANLGGGRDSSLDYGWYTSAVSLGQMIGPGIAGFLIDSFGFGPTWGAIAVIFAAAGVMFMVIVGPGFVDPAHPATAGGSRRRAGKLLAISAVVAILANFVVLFARGARDTFFPIYLDGLHFSASAIGALLSLCALVSVLTRLVMPWYVQLCRGRYPALLISMAVLSVGIGLTPLARGIGGLCINAVVVGFGVGIAPPLVMAMVVDGVRPQERGLALGTRLIGNRLAQISSPLFFGAVSLWFGVPTAFVAGGSVLLLATVPILAWWRQGRVGGQG